MVPMTRSSAPTLVQVAGPRPDGHGGGFGQMIYIPWPGTGSRLRTRDRRAATVRSSAVGASAFDTTRPWH